jgi:hypothetical protein
VDIPRAHAVALDEQTPERVRKDDENVGSAVDNTLEAAFQGARDPALAGQGALVCPRALKVHDKRPAANTTKNHWKCRQGKMDVHNLGIAMPLYGRGDGTKPSCQRSPERSHDLHEAVVAFTLRVARNKASYRRTELAKRCNQLSKVAVQPSVSGRL